MLAALESGRHAFLFSVTDKRTEVKTLKLFYVNATTITSEGWMLLCDEGSEERVRLDMLAQISVDRIVPAYEGNPAKGWSTGTVPRCEYRILCHWKCYR